MQSEARKGGNAQGMRLAVGLDIGKKVHVAALLTSEGAVGRPVRVKANRDGFEQLAALVEATRAQVGADDVLVGLEPTGHYWRTVANYLEKKSYVVAFVNPAHTKRMKEVEDNSPDKSDPKDARIVADLVLRGKTLGRAPCDGVYGDLRELGRLRHGLVTQRTACENRMQRILDVAFPELLDVLGPVKQASTRAALRLGVTASDYIKAGRRRLSRVLRDASRKQLGREKAIEILEVADRSVGIEDGAAVRRLEMSQLLKRWRELKKQIDGIEEKQKNKLAEVPYADALLAVAGLGVVTVAMVLGEAGDLRRYHRASGLIKMAGLNLYSNKSGMKQTGRPQIAKRGRPLLRHALHLAAVRMVGPDGPMVPFYRRLRANGVVSTKSLVAVSRKLLRAMFAMARDNVEFDEERLESQSVKRAA